MGSRRGVVPRPDTGLLGVFGLRVWPDRVRPSWKRQHARLGVGGLRSASCDRSSRWARTRPGKAGIERCGGTCGSERTWCRPAISRISMDGQGGMHARQSPARTIGAWRSRRSGILSMHVRCRRDPGGRRPLRARRRSTGRGLPVSLAPTNSRSRLSGLASWPLA